MPLDDLGFRDRIGPLDKIERVIELLAREENWCKGELLTADGRRCIMGTVKEVDGDDVLVRPILTAIRQVTSRRFAQIELFNDDPATNHPLVRMCCSGRAKTSSTQSPAIVALAGGDSH